MVIKNVSRGEPITALWANSLVNEVNLNQGIRLRGRNVNDSSGSRIQMASEPAFQIRYTKNGYVTLNAGQIYINGYLVTQTAEEGQTAQHSYNQFSSIKNWDKYAIHQMANGVEDLPEWYILITSPKKVTESNISEVEAELVKKTKGQAKPTKPENIGDDKLWACVQISKVVDNQLLQLVSGSIFFTTPSESSSSYDGELSIIAGDGINVDFDSNDNAYTISAKLSIIPTDDFIAVNQYTDTSGTIMVELSKGASAITADPISLIQGTNIILSKNTANNSYTINGYRTYVEAGKNVDIESKFSRNSTTYTITAKCIQSIIAGDGLFVSKIDDDGIYIALGDGGTQESKIEIDGIITTDGNYRTWDTIGDGSMGVNLAHLQIGTSTYNLHMEILTDSNYKKFLKFSF